MEHSGVAAAPVGAGSSHALDDVFRVAFEQSAAGVSVATPDGKYLHANAAFCEFVGYSVAELRGMSALDLTHRDDDRRARELWQRMMCGEMSEARWERRFLHKSGAIVWGLQTVTFVRGPAGEQEYLVSQVIDVSDRKIAEETLQRAEEALKERDDQLRQAQKMEAIGQLAGGIAHDFNNLLMAIMSNAELASLELPPSSSAAQNIEEIRAASRRARSLTQQLLAFSRKQMLQPRVLDINAVIRDALVMLRRLIGEHIAMTVELEPALHTVRADPGQLVQVLMNLVVNARDALSGGGAIVIETANRVVTERDVRLHRGLRAGEYVAMSVRDSGIGMDEQTKARIFEPFFTTKPPGEGTGLGLSTAYGIIKQSDGYIAVDSSVAGGSTFTIFLPRVTGEIKAATPLVANVLPPLSKGTVLLVEDEVAVREATKRMLRKFGYTVLEARHGEDALIVWEQSAESVDVVITDVVMPVMGGAALVKQLRERRPGVRVIFMSGYTQGTLELSPDDAAATRFLAKPFTSEQLVGALAELVAAR